MLTKKAYYRMLDDIYNSGGLTDEMKSSLEKIKGELDEREGILARYGEEYDGELDDYDFRERPIKDYFPEYQEMSRQYDELVKKYNDRFINRKNDEQEEKEVEKEEITIDDLFDEKGE